MVGLVVWDIITVFGLIVWDRGTSCHFGSMGIENSDLVI